MPLPHSTHSIVCSNACRCSDLTHAEKEWLMYKSPTTSVDLLRDSFSLPRYRVSCGNTSLAAKRVTRMDVRTGMQVTERGFSCGRPSPSSDLILLPPFFFFSSSPSRTSPVSLILRAAAPLVWFYSIRIIRESPMCCVLPAPPTFLSLRNYLRPDP